MKLPTIQRFQKQNYPGSPDWFTRFIGDLNNFTETMWNILNRNVTLSDNVDAQIYTLSILAGAAASNNTATFTSTLNHTPQAVVVGNCVDAAAYSSPLSTAVYISWSFNAPQISIQSVTGLTSGHTYSLTLVVF